MSRAKLLYIAMAVVFLCSHYSSFAFDDWLPINPEELKMTADPAHPGDAIMLYHEETADDITRHRHVYKRVKILTEKGRDHANVSIEYDASFIGISDIKARTIAPDGTITPFTGKAFTSTVVKAHNAKYLAKTFTLPNVQAGSIIEWKYTEFWEDFLFAPHWVVQDDLFQKKAKFTFIPFQTKIAGVTVQDSHGNVKDRVYYVPVALPENTAIKTLPNGGLGLELTDIPAFVEEDFAPPPDLLRMSVNFYYGTDKIAKPEQFWKDEGKYWIKDIESFAGHSAAVTAAVNQVVSPSDTPEQKARKIYAYVQKVKNLSYTARENALEQILDQSKQKRTVDDVLRNHEGHRDEITRLFWAMARAAGLPAYMMRVSDRDKFFFQSAVPNPRQLTSEVAAVALNDKEVFLDPGTPFCPFGHLSWQHSSTKGMRQYSDGSIVLAITPVAKYTDAISERVGHIALNADGSAKGKIGLVWKGEEALVHRLRALTTDDAGRKKDLEDELRALLPPGTSVQLDKATGWDDGEVPLAANFSVEIPSYASGTGKRMIVPTDLFEARNVQPFSQSERKQPIYFDYPFYHMDDTQITMPATFHLESMAQDGEPIKSDYSIYKVKHSTTGNIVTVSRDFAMGAVTIPQKDFPQLRKFYNDVVTSDAQPLVLAAQ